MILQLFIMVRQDVPIVAVYCEGFKSRIWATEVDISDHAVLSAIVKAPKEKRNTINFKNFYESARKEIIEIFKNFDLEPIFLYANATVEELEHMSESIATTCICGTLGNYLGNGLEENWKFLRGGEKVMAMILDKQRYKCALGAMQTVQAIERAIPVLHPGPGCARKLSNSSGSSGYFSPNIYPCTSINEKDVVFGGGKKLRSTIENSLKVIDADLYVVLTGWIPEIVGDNTEEIVEEFTEAEKPVIYARTAGVKGNNFKGHEQSIDAIIDGLLKPSQEKEKGLVNIWVDVSYQAEFWLGNFRKLEKLIAELGLIPNTIFGYQRGLPIGAFETGKFLRKIGEFAGVKKEKVEQLIQEKEADYYYYIERFADLFLETRVMSKQFSVVADARYALGITKFFVNDLGLFPAKHFVVDDTPKQFQEKIKQYFFDLNYGIKAEVSFETDGYKIHNEIKSHDYHGYPLILGSYWEEEVSQQTNEHFLNVSWPVNERLVMNGYHVGYDGGLRLIEDIYSVAKTRFNERRRYMSYKIAVASSDGVRVDVSFGGAGAIEKIALYFDRADNHQTLRGIAHEVI